MTPTATPGEEPALVTNTPDTAPNRTAPAIRHLGPEDLGPLEPVPPARRRDTDTGHLPRRATAAPRTGRDGHTRRGTRDRLRPGAAVRPRGQAAVEVRPAA